MPPLTLSTNDSIRPSSCDDALQFACQGSRTTTSTPARPSDDQQRPQCRAMVEFFGAMGTPVVGHARTWVAAVAAAWGVGTEGLNNLELVASELVTNAWAHTTSRRGLITVYLGRGHDGAVRIVVRDEGRTDGAAPALGNGLWLEHGRGLALVAAFSTRWGVEPYTVDSPAAGQPSQGHLVWAHPDGAYTA